ncbi:protein kinase, cAMP-dependent, regulatory, type II, alpha, B isoform X4 [Entelurus aequoreus]|uniref:protein kinase, cAMP-dependent, regulatory, type II, alpha, B isoform X4 n=1 Tax=Entelurus aequoreus TaxID=161455 RepID=UPI002B1DED92|nr:protein kinase, cAMP-dependent, regulatory, type II, alpha, B isoform X4 [Entelurus aequoreus]
MTAVQRTKKRKRRRRSLSTPPNTTAGFQFVQRPTTLTTTRKATASLGWCIPKQTNSVGGFRRPAETFYSSKLWSRSSSLRFWTPCLRCRSKLRSTSSTKETTETISTSSRSAPAGDVNYFLCALPGQSHLPPADGEEQRQEEEDVRGLRGMCSSAQVFGALGENEDRGRVGSTKLQRWRAHHRAGNTSVSSEWTPCGHVTSLWHSQGDMADCFYIVETGQVRIMIKSKTNAGQQDQAEVEVARCSQGQYFGELALVTNKPRAASVYAVGHTKCLVIDIQAFERLLGPCKEILKRNISQYEEQLVALFGSSVDLKH